MKPADEPPTPSGEVYCFEVNPSPAFSYYEANTGQPIAQAVARLLAAGQQAPVRGEDASPASSLAVGSVGVP